MVKAITLLSLITLTGCSGFVNSNSPQGYFTLSSDAKGMQAFSDALIGIKAPESKQHQYWNTRKLNIKEETRREFAPTFLSDLFGTTKAVPANTEPSEQPESNS